MEKIVIIGATSSIAEQCARLWVIDPAVKDIVLIARDQSKLESIAADLAVRDPMVSIEIFYGDLIDPISIEKLVEKSFNGVPPDMVLIAHGSLPNQKQSQANLQLIEEAIQINAISPTLFAEAYAGRMVLRDSGIISVIGSVAGDRGRKSNYIYGSAKGLVDRYVQGLQHRLAGTGVTAILIKPGPTDTPMTSEMKANGLKMASASSVARDIVRGISERRSVIYAPNKWKYIMLVIRHIPDFIFNKLDI